MANIAMWRITPPELGAGMLDVLGIREFDERVYRVLLADPDQSVRSIAEALDATVGRVQQAMIRLVELGLVRREGLGRYSAVGPRTALLSLLARQRAAAETAFTDVHATVEELADVYRAGRLRGDPTGLVEVVAGRDEVNRRVDELTKAVRTHLWVFDRPPYLEWANGESDTNETEFIMTTRMIEQGVDIRSIYCPESMQRPGRFETVLRLAAAGEQSRMLPSVPFKLRIMDRRTALVSLIGNSYDSLAIVRASGLLDALIELFEVYWAKAEPITGAEPARRETPAEADLLVLRMLNAGLKDDAVARQLGVSPRTANRRIAAVLSQLGAGTRFQAGVEAARRGWV